MSISQPYDVLPSSDHSDLDSNTDDFSSCSDGASHDELSECSELDLNRLTLLQKLSYRPAFRIGSYGPRYYSEPDSDMDILSVDSNLPFISSHQYDSYTSIKKSINCSWKPKQHVCHRQKQFNSSSTSLGSSLHYELVFNDTSGSEL